MNKFQNATFFVQFGGGRVIRPGDQLETAEDKIAKEKQTKELIAAYRKKMGFTIDAQTKLECEKVYLWQ